MKDQEPDIIKSSGEIVKFSFSKLRRSLLKSGASKSIVSSIINDLRDKIYQGISTKELHNQAFELLKEFKGAYASRYNLKKAIYELGPSGFPFEKFVSKILRKAGYNTDLNVILKGECVTHEIDIIAHKNSIRNLIECKFHSEEGRNCDVKIPLYIFSRFEDIYSFEAKKINSLGWLVTNTKFTTDASTYAKCKGLKLLSWDHPEKESLKDLIDQSGEYPITTSTLLSGADKKYLLDNGIILGRELIEKSYLLEYLQISKKRKEKILSELIILCNKNNNHGK